ncbi:hypothetical protein QE152_g19669 [Popillia japonica]|uniref:Uncharacterized protein n=1 Tax=Popillia japonica TaxID=7064 RepID=A0AAW1KMY7_POPJA
MEARKVEIDTGGDKATTRASTDPNWWPRIRRPQPLKFSERSVYPSRPPRKPVRKVSDGMMAGLAETKDLKFLYALKGKLERFGNCAAFPFRTSNMH